MAVSKPLPGQQIDRTAPYAGVLLGVWPFNEGGGVRINDNVGVRASASGSATALTWSGRGGVFNGASTVVDVSGANPGLLKTSKFSGLVKFNTTAAGQVALIAAWKITVSPGWEFSINTSHQLYFIFSDAYGSNYFIVATTATFNDGKDHVAEFTYDGSNAGAGVSIYVDGAKQAVSISTAGTADPGAVTDFSIVIGRRNWATQPNWYAGSIGALALWSAKLDAWFSQALTANPWQLWPDDQIVYAPGGTSTTVTVTGFAGTGSVGNSVPLAVTFPTSLLGTGSQGTPIYRYGNTFTPTGVSGTGAIGTPTYKALFVPAGSEGTGAVGSPTPLVVFAPTGAAGTGSIGTTTPQVLLTPTGYVGTGDIGSVTFSIASTFTPTGLAGTGALGTTLELVTLTPTGQVGTGAVGTPTFAIGSTFVATGVEGVGALGGVYPVVTFTPSGLAGTSAQGSPVPQSLFKPTGAAGTGQTGAVAFIINSTYSPDGVQAAGQIGSVTLLGWLVVQDGQTPGWGAVTNTQTPSWSQVTAAQTPGWSQPSTAQTPSWTNETTTQTPTWTPVDTQE